MPKDEADAIMDLARQLMEEDVSVERRCRLARKIAEHAKAIRASCMAEPEWDLFTYGTVINTFVWGGKVSTPPSTRIPPNYG